MSGLLEQHATLASFLVLFLEDLGVPMPVPADVVIMYAGYRAHMGAVHPVLIFLLMTLAVNGASSILYLVVRRGGRPLIERFGRYVHLNDQRLSRAESFLRRLGTPGIVLSRSLPGARLATVIACGLFRIPFARFLLAQVTGTFLYMMFFFLIGYYLGPQAVERLRLPAHSLRLLLMLVVGIGLPVALRLVNRDTSTDNTAAIEPSLTRRQRIGASLLAGFAGMVELSMIWGAFVSLAHLMNRAEVQSAATTLARFMAGSMGFPGFAGGSDGLGGRRAIAFAYGLDYLATLLVCLLMALFFFHVVRPRLHISQSRLGRQIAALWALMLLSVEGAVVISILHHVAGHGRPGSLWLSESGGIVLVGIVLGLLGHSYVAVETHRLAVDRFCDNPQLAPSALT